MQTWRVNGNTTPSRACGQPSSVSLSASQACCDGCLSVCKATCSAVLRENSQLSSSFLKLRSTNNTHHLETRVTAYVQGNGAQRELLFQTHHQGDPATMTELDVPQERTVAAHAQPIGSLHAWPVSRHRLAAMPPPHANAAHTSRMSTLPPAHRPHLDQYSRRQQHSSPSQACDTSSLLQHQPDDMLIVTRRMEALHGYRHRLQLLPARQALTRAPPGCAAPAGCPWA